MSIVFFNIFSFVGDNAFQRFQNLVVGGLHGFYFVDEDHIPCFKLSCSGPSPYNLISGLYVTKCPWVPLLITYFHFKLYLFFFSLIGKFLFLLLGEFSLGWFCPWSTIHKNNYSWDYQIWVALLSNKSHTLIASNSKYIASFLLT